MGEQVLLEYFPPGAFFTNNFWWQFLTVSVTGFFLFAFLVFSVFEY
jgi:hypothetical protein